MSFAGVDFDTHAVHVVKVYDDGPVTYVRFELEGVDAFMRTRWVRDAMPSRSSAFWDETVAIGIEEPQGIAKSTVAKLKAVQGAVLACLPRDHLVHEMVPARWRTAVGLPGNASKEAVARFARSQVPSWIVTYGSFTTTSSSTVEQDGYDAYCLALAVSKLTEDVAA